VSSLADVLDDLINDASLPAWNALPPEVAARDALASADEGDAFVATLAPAITSRRLAEGRPRSLHRSEHRREAWITSSGRSSGDPPTCGRPSEPFLRRGC
jgi:hypothetical protein